MSLPYWTENADPDWTETNVVGSFTNLANANSFDAIFESASENLSAMHKVKLNGGFLTADTLNDPTIVADFKQDLLGVFEESVNQLATEMEKKYGIDDIGNTKSLYDQLSQLYDNKIDQYIQESSVGQLLPIKSVDFPIMVKAQVKNSFKDIVNEEITPSLVIKKQVEHKIVYAKKDPSKSWEYPQCFFNEDFKEMTKYGRGTDLSTEAVALPLFNYNIIEELTDAPVATAERLQVDIGIDKVEVADGTVVTLRTPMHVNMADGSWIGGIINENYTNASDQPAVLTDVISGFLDWTTGITSLNSASGAVKKVYFTGKLSNDGNQNTVRFTYRREDKEWKVEEGFKVDSAYTLEELQEHKAMLNMDLYQKTYNDLTNLITDMEDSEGYDWLDTEFEKYKGLKLDPLQWNPMVKETKFNCDSTIATVALPSEYIAKELKFKIDRFLIDISDDVKMDNMKFVLYGNPRYISLLDPAVKWVFRTGDRVGGVKLDYSYGVMTSGDTTIYVVSTKKLNAQTHKTLRLIPFAPESETITFKRFKFSTDIVTSKESAYKDTEKAGGSMTYVWGASRYKDISLQAIQGDIAFENADFITL